MSTKRGIRIKGKHSRNGNNLSGTPRVKQLKISGND